MSDPNPTVTWAHGAEEKTMSETTQTLNRRYDDPQGPQSVPPEPSTPAGFLGSLWALLDGNKTTIGALLLVAPEILQDTADTLVQLGVPAEKIGDSTGKVEHLNAI